MDKTRVLLLAIVALALATLACTRSATDPVTPTPSDDDLVLTQMAEMGLEASEYNLTLTAMAQPTEPAPTPTPEPSGETSPEPTTAPTEPPSPEPTVAPPEPTAAPPATPVPPTEPPTPPGGETSYTVQPGDNLFRIALRHGMRAEELAAYNGITNPALIYPGQVIRIPAGGETPPPSGGDILYTVQPGDNLFRIALRYNMSYLYLASYNGITPPYYVYPGQVIRIPDL
ncbi:MAG: LysM peptidoglycan-binding domain-containing protein [Anaerolineae bacterium]|nr:LysM peptidoglycan-binding domain-containing protein [Anaerolineae bacterium]